MSITLKILFSLVGLLLTSTIAWGNPNFADPAIPPHTKLVYQIEEAKNKFEYTLINLPWAKRKVQLVGRF